MIYHQNNKQLFSAKGSYVEYDVCNKKKICLKF